MWTSLAKFERKVSKILETFITFHVFGNVLEMCFINKLSFFLCKILSFLQNTSPHGNVSVGIQKKRFENFFRISGFERYTEVILNDFAINSITWPTQLSFITGPLRLLSFRLRIRKSTLPYHQLC